MNIDDLLKTAIQLIEYEPPVVQKPKLPPAVLKPIGPEIETEFIDQSGNIVQV